MWKLLVILVFIKRFTRNDIFKQNKKKHEQNGLNVVRKCERLLAKLMKLQADIKFIKICKEEY